MRFTSVTLPGIGFFFFAACTSSASFVSNPALLNPNDSILWSQLGNAGASISPSFIVISVNGVMISGSFDKGGGGTVAQVCPTANCDYAGAPGFNPGDFLLWTEDTSGRGTGPLTLTFTTPVQGVGFYLEL